MMRDDQELWSTNQAAEYLGVKRQSVHELAKRGEVGQQVGRAWVFTKAELDAWLAKPRPKGGRPPKKTRGRDVAPSAPGVADTPPPAHDPTAIPPALGGRVRLTALGDEPAHLTADGETTLCDLVVYPGSHTPTRRKRNDCQDCRRIADEQGLTLERRA